MQNYQNSTMQLYNIIFFLSCNPTFVWKNSFYEYFQKFKNSRYFWKIENGHSNNFYDSFPTLTLVFCTHIINNIPAFKYRYQLTILSCIKIFKSHLYITSYSSTVYKNPHFWSENWYVLQKNSNTFSCHVLEWMYQHMHLVFTLKIK